MGPPGGIVSFRRLFVFMGPVALFRAGDFADLRAIEGFDGRGMRCMDFSPLARLAAMRFSGVGIRFEYA